MKKSKILLHACCAPCLTSVYERLQSRYDIDVLWYNPNIYPVDEEEKRLTILLKYIKEIRANLIIHPTAKSDADEWLDEVVDYRDEPEGRRRCATCIYFRLSKVAQFAKKEQYPLFTTTLSVSPRKNAEVINSHGKSAAVLNGVDFLAADFKKQNGFGRSVEMANNYNLYRQNYCGCRFSLAEKIKRLRGQHA